MITYSKLQAIWDAYNDFRIYDFGEALKVKEFLSREENKDLTVDQALIELGMESEGDAPWYNVVIDCIVFQPETKLLIAAPEYTSVNMLSGRNPDEANDDSAVCPMRILQMFLALIGVVEAYWNDISVNVLGVLPSSLAVIICWHRE